jgi:uncharacterized protein (DUF1778 family)
MKLRLSKSIAIMAVISLLAAGTALAQRKEGGRDWQEGPPSAEQQLVRLTTALSLDSEQSVELLVVLQEQAENRAAMHEQVMELIGPEVCAQRAAFEEAILAILDEEQTTQFLQILDDRQSNHRGRRSEKLDCEG